MDPGYPADWRGAMALVRVAGVPLPSVVGSRRPAALAQSHQIEFLQGVMPELLRQPRTRMENKPHKHGTVWPGLNLPRGSLC